jgi:uncharacterized protein (DUF433 family)
MDLDLVIAQLSHQAEAIRALVHGVPDAQARWKPSPDDWSILEVIHHLVDEEIEDFRRHLDHILYHADQPWPRIDPGGWVTQRRYNEQDPAAVLAKFLAEREKSLAWLATLGSAGWHAAIAMPWGSLTAGDMLASWAAHDLLHLRQLVELHYAWTQQALAPYSVEYAGESSGRRYAIIETDMGPLISESRLSVFDVMEAHDAGDSQYEIGLTFNLSPIQVETALVYIAQHRVELEPQLARIRQQLADREAFYRHQAAEADAYLATLPMTSQRAALRVLRERSDSEYRVSIDADGPQ